MYMYMRMYIHVYTHVHCIYSGVEHMSIPYLVELSHCPEHSLACLLSSELPCASTCFAGLHTNNVGRVPPQSSHEPVIRASQQLDYVVIERVHVLHEPLVAAVVHLCGEGGREGNNTVDTVFIVDL